MCAPPLSIYHFLLCCTHHSVQQWISAESYITHSIQVQSLYFKNFFFLVSLIFTTVLIKTCKDFTISQTNGFQSGPQQFGGKLRKKKKLITICPENSHNRQNLMFAIVPEQTIRDRCNYGMATSLRKLLCP